MAEHRHIRSGRQRVLAALVAGFAVSARLARRGGPVLAAAVTGGLIAIAAACAALQSYFHFIDQH